MAPMASLHSLYPSILLVVTLALSLFLSPTLSTSRGFHSPKTTSSGFHVSLHHVDSGKNLTKFERLHRSMNRGKYRLQRLSSSMVVISPSSGSSSEEVQAQVRPGTGEFIMKLSIGTPAEPFSAIMDTGSDLIWTQCSPCTHCYNQSTPIFDPKKSSSFSQLSCSSPLCEALPNPSCGDNKGCAYSYTYGDYSSTEGVMGSETFTFGGKNDGVPVTNVAFGCGDDNEGDGFDQASGLVGLGRGRLSLVSQLVEPKFSYCLTSIDDTKTSSLLMGSIASPNIKSVTTALIKNPVQPSFYYLSLEGITVGATRIDIDKSTFQLQEDGSGGLIIDSGTTLTYLEQSTFDRVQKEFVAQTTMSVDDSGAGGLDLCFTLPSTGSRSTQEEVEVPKLVFHFSGGADLDLPSKNYMVSDPDVGVACLAMGASSGMSIIGNIQQQNMLVLHDLQKETLSFTPTDCSRL